MMFGNALPRYGSRGSCPKEVRMSLVGTLAKVALGVAAVKGAGYVASQMAGGSGEFGRQRRAFPDRTQRGRAPPSAQPGIGDLLTSVLGGKGQAGGGPWRPTRTARCRCQCWVQSRRDSTGFRRRSRRADQKSWGRRNRTREPPARRTPEAPLPMCRTRPSRNWANPRSRPRHNRMLPRA